MAESTLTESAAVRPQYDARAGIIWRREGLRQIECLPQPVRPLLDLGDAVLSLLDEDPHRGYLAPLKSQNISLPGLTRITVSLS